jgi:drug/metabolite transporter (DMT)-like permease
MPPKRLGRGAICQHFSLPHPPGAAPISLSVFLLVLLAAALHAGWNAIIKVKLEPFLAMVLIAQTGAIVMAPFVFWTGLPDKAALPWLVGSVVVHIGYYIALAAAYERADMGQVYPIARGTAPMLTGIVSVTVLAEPVTAIGIAGIALLGLGIFVMSMKSAADAARMDRKALFFAALTAVFICLYTISDGNGARASGNHAAYSVALFISSGVAFTAVAIAMRGLSGLKPILGFAGPGFAGGAMSAGAYTIAIWAMTVAPIPLVAAVRETSVLFGAIIAVVVLREPLRATRIVAAGLIVAGLVLIRLQ